MLVTSTWAEILRRPAARKVVLATISLGGNKHSRSEKLWSGALRAATDAAVDISHNGRRVPYWPTLTDWPVITWEFDRQTRIARTLPVSIALSADAEFPFAATDLGGAANAWCRLDLWSDGIDLNHTLPLVEGPVTAAQFDSRTGGIQLTVADGQDTAKNEFPPGGQVIGRDLFPELPDYALGIYRRQTLVGPLTYPILAVPVSANECYLVDPPLTTPPARSEVLLDGSESELLDFVDTATAADGVTQYTRLVFHSEPFAAPGSVVTVTGGYGLAAGKHPLEYLLVDVAGLRLTERTENILTAAPLDVSILANLRGVALDLVTQRLLPQLPYALAFSRGAVDLLPLGGDFAQLRLQVGSGLMDMVSSSITETAANNVVNAIEISYQRNVFATDDTGTGTRTYFLDKSTADTDLASLLVLSERLYGRRFLHIDTPDLIASTTAVPVSVKTLARQLLLTRALVHRGYTYDAAEWWPALAARVGSCVRLSDSAEGLADVNVVVTRLELHPTQPRLTFETLDQSA